MELERLGSSRLRSGAAVSSSSACADAIETAEKNAKAMNRMRATRPTLRRLSLCAKPMSTIPRGSLGVVRC